jgi:hypothetical protein
MLWYSDAGSNGRRVYVPFCPALAESCYGNRHPADRCLDSILGVGGGPRNLSGDVRCVRVLSYPMPRTSTPAKVPRAPTGQARSQILPSGTP